MALPRPEMCNHRSGEEKRGKLHFQMVGEPSLFLSFIYIFLLLLFFFLWDKKSNYCNCLPN